MNFSSESQRSLWFGSRRILIAQLIDGWLYVEFEAHFESGAKEPVHVSRSLTEMCIQHSETPNLNDLPTEILLRFTDHISPFLRARTLPLVSRRFYHLEKRFWIDCRSSRFSKLSCPKSDFSRCYPCLKPSLQKALRINASTIPLQTVLIPSSYVALSHLLLSEASEAR